LTSAGENWTLGGMEESLFTKIIARKIPAKIVHEDDRLIVIHDIAPQAPVHLLVIPKKQVATLNELTATDASLVGELFLAAAQVMKKLGYSEYRTVFNCGETAGQTVWHIHLHVMAGRPFNWPPG
jgi:histidine triad (HIT) family protein